MSEARRAGGKIVSIVCGLYGTSVRQVYGALRRLGGVIVCEAQAECSAKKFVQRILNTDEGMLVR